jgi:polar amino acid transport system substrate-binding protein
MKRILLLPFVALLLAAVVSGCDRPAKTIRNFEDAATARIGVMTGSTGEATAAARFPKAKIARFDDVMDAVTALKSGQLDAIVTAFPAALQVTKKNPEFGLLPDALTHEDSAIAVRKGNHELLAAVNRIISELKADGTLDSMKARWFKPDLGPYDELDIVPPAEGEVLRIGVSATREPFSFVDAQGRVTGHDGELARIIGAKLRRPVEFSNMKFMALIPALQSGKIDLIVSGMTATDERRQSVDFSQPYYANAQVMLVRKATAGIGPESGLASSPASAARNAITGLPDIDGKRIAVLSGSAGDLAARRHFPRARFQVAPAAADAALAVKTSKADAFVYDRSVLLNLVERNPDLVIIDEPVARLEVAAAIAMGNTALLADFDRVLQALQDEGALAGLRQKWVDSKYSRVPPLPAVDDSRAQGVLRMGTCALIEPFSFHSNGVITGLDIELAHMIGERLGKHVEIVDMSFESLIPALQAGKIDFALSNFNVTDERRKLVLFTMPYITNDISALVRRPPAGTVETAAAGDGGSVKLVSTADLRDKRIGVLLGSAHDTYATRNYPDATILQYKSPADVALAVRTGKVDAALFDAEPLRDILRQDGSLGILGDPLFSFPVAAGFNSANDALREQFNRFLAEIRRNGVYDDMVRRWMEQRDETMPPIDNPRSGDALVVGVSDVGLPFTAVKDGRLVGFDIELAERFGASLGRDVRFSNMDFGSLIAAVSTGKTGLIARSIYVTEEREKQIDFSDPYYEMGTLVFALKRNIAAAGPDGSQATGTVSFYSSVANSFYRNIILENRYLLIWDGLKTTVGISVLATVLGTLLGAAVCFMRMSGNIVLKTFARIYIAVLRGTPVLVLLMLIFYVVFASVDINPALVAVIAFGMNFAAYVSEIFRTGIEGVDKGQTEAGISIGFTPVSTFIYIVLPQTVQRILPVYKGEFISLVKMTSIVGYIAVQDLTKASDIIRSRTFDAFFPLVMVAILYFAISWILMQSLEYLEKVTDPKFKRARAGEA